MRPVKQQRPQIHNFHPREGGDIEFGVDKRIPTTSRPNIGHGGHGEGIGPQQPPANGNNMRGNFEMKHGHEEELRAGA